MSRPQQGCFALDSKHASLLPNEAFVARGLSQAPN